LGNIYIWKSVPDLSNLGGDVLLKLRRVDNLDIFQQADVKLSNAYSDEKTNIP
jgi:hypothetical protein